MIRPYTEIEGLTGRVIRCAIEVHRQLGPGLLESVYKECLCAELKADNVAIESEVSIPLDYKRRRLASKLRVDLWIGRLVIVEVKAVEALRPIHESQLITYLKLTGSPAGLLINFNEVLLKHGLKRLDRPDLYFKTKSS